MPPCCRSSMVRRVAAERRATAASSDAAQRPVPADRRAWRSPPTAMPRARDQAHERHPEAPARHERADDQRSRAATASALAARPATVAARTAAGCSSSRWPSRRRRTSSRRGSSARPAGSRPRCRGRAARCRSVERRRVPGTTPAGARIASAALLGGARRGRSTPRGRSRQACRSALHSGGAGVCSRPAPWRSRGPRRGDRPGVPAAWPANSAVSRSPRPTSSRIAAPARGSGSARRAEPHAAQVAPSPRRSAASSRRPSAGRSRVSWRNTDSRSARTGGQLARRRAARPASTRVISSGWSAPSTSTSSPSRVDAVAGPLEHRGRGRAGSATPTRCGTRALAEQVLDRPGGEQPAVADDRHRVADLLHLGQDVRAQQHRDPGRRRARGSSSRMSRMPAGSRPLVGSSRISRSGVLEQGGRDRQPLLHAERVGLVAVALAAGQADLLERRVARGVGSTPDRAGEQREVLAAGEARARTWAARRPRRPGRSPRAARPGTGSPKSAHLAGAGAGQAEQHPDRGGLARAVGAEEAVHAAGGHRQVEAVDGDDPAPAPAAELLAQTRGLDDEVMRPASSTLPHGASDARSRADRRVGVRRAG